MSAQTNWPVAIIGAGNVGTDLMMKVRRSGGPLTMGAVADVDPHSAGVARAAGMGVPITAGGVDGLLAMSNFADIKLVFDASSAQAHRANWAARRHRGARARPHPGRDRAVLRAGGQSRRTSRRAKPEPGHLCRAGNRADCRGGGARVGLSPTPRWCRRSRRSRPDPARALALMTSSNRPRSRCKSLGVPGVARRC